MRNIEINCDVGEGFDNEAELFPYIQSCNIACGGHTGDQSSMQNVVELAIKNNIKIGAHPSYPDKINFGRKTLVMKERSLQDSIRHQVNSLHQIVLNNGGVLHHIKPHGALYNDIAKNNELAIHFLNAIKPFKAVVKLYVPYNSAIAANAKKFGFKIIYEAFADRNYNDDLSLLTRKGKNALLTDPAKILQHVLYMLNNGKVNTISGNKIPIKVQTFCVHSDTKNAVEIVRKLYHEIMF
jgi:UPF0271 protein